MHVVMILQSCGNIAFGLETLANRLKSMCLRDDHLVCLFVRLLVSQFVFCLFMCVFVCFFICLLLGVTWPRLSCVSFLTFAGVACHYWRCSALLVFCLALFTAACRSCTLFFANAFSVLLLACLVGGWGTESAWTFMSKAGR